MDREVSRAIALKAALEFLQKEAKLSPRKLGEEAEIQQVGEFLRANASANVLRAGLPAWREALQNKLIELKSAESLPNDPAFELNLKFALDGELPRPPPAIDWSRWVQPSLKPIVLAELSGTWMLFRKSGSGPGETPWVNASLLNIRPNAYYTKHPTEWTLFALWAKEENAPGPRRSSGACVYVQDSLHLVGMSNNAASPLPLALTVRHELGNIDTPQRVHEATGVMFVTDTNGVQIARGFDAVFMVGSENWKDEEYQRKRGLLLQHIGSQPYDLIAHLYPRERYEKLMAKPEA